MVALTERLAENTHELWAAERIRQGWTFGPERSDVKMEHPCLIPYEQLPEEEKVLDRAAAIGSLRAILALGGTINFNPVLALQGGESPAGWVEHLNKEFAAAIPGSARCGNFDLDDTLEIAQLKSAGALKAAEGLQFLQDSVLPEWKRADEDAIQQQCKHRLIAAFAIWPGILAIILAILQLALNRPGLVSPSVTGIIGYLETGAIAITVVAIALGFRMQWHHGWLASRQRAERLRILKFQALSWPEFWCTFEGWKRRVVDEVAKLRNINPHNAREWVDVKGEVRPELPDAPDCPVSAMDIMALADYYRVKRLEFQQAYFLRQYDKVNRQSAIGRWKLSLVFFLLSVLSVMAHNLMHYAGSHAPSILADSSLRPLEITAVTLAALFPVLGFGFRAWLAAFEAPRSRSLYRAKAYALDGYIERSESDRANMTRIMHHIAHGEHFFAGEHREWCRLQMEAEWFA